MLEAGHFPGLRPPSSRGLGTISPFTTRLSPTSAFNCKFMGIKWPIQLTWLPHPTPQKGSPQPYLCSLPLCARYSQ